MQFTLLPGDERAEAEVLRRYRYGTELTIRFELFLPESSRLTNDHQSIVLAQLKAPNSWSPPVALRLKGDHELVLTVRHHTRDGADQQGEEAWVRLDKSRRGEWQAFELTVRTGADGYASISTDGKLVARYEGPVGYKGLDSYFKFGPYDFTCGLREPFVVLYRRWRIEERPDGGSCDTKKTP